MKAHSPTETRQGTQPMAPLFGEHSPPLLLPWGLPQRQLRSGPTAARMGTLEADRVKILGSTPYPGCLGHQ